MKLVVAGLGRTGTQSLVAALHQLGLRTLSQEDIVPNPAIVTGLVEAVRGTVPLDLTLLSGVDATVGWPLCWLYEEQLAAFPEAKCLLNVRDADAWYDSVSRAFGILRPLTRLGFNARVRAAGSMLDLLEHKMGGPMERGRWTAAYRAHTETVRAAVPADRLLVYEVGEGWEPLCGLLGLPVPSTPFPTGNSSVTDQFRTKVMELLR